ncbi:MAG: hypothetical protein A2Y76_11365 [Planctomycetes bacterium RBG_13_60_9]|nr:MAG: hypothetical protein A2Y76_11365 [Planctomycetes bacterium RBG_13_60_9]
MDELSQQIAEHQAAVGALNSRVDQLTAAVDEATAAARSLLEQYQERKRQAGEALGTAGRQFLTAQRMFRRADDLLADLAALKEAHVTLSYQVSAFVKGDADRDEVQRVLRDFVSTRRVLQRTYRRIERCRHDARAADEAAADTEAVEQQSERQDQASDQGQGLGREEL